MNTQFKLKSGLERNFWIKWVTVLIAISIIQLILLYPFRIENRYSTHLYPKLAQILRLFTGWVPFSIGDIIYVLTGFALLVSLIRGTRYFFNSSGDWWFLFNGISRWARGLLWIYVWFMVVWGFNYNRLGIASQLHLNPPEYCKEEVVALTSQLIFKVNSSRKELKDTLLTVKPLSELFEEAELNYDSLSNRFPFLDYSGPSIKPSLYSPLGSYFGFTGYYNPFTGEAQVRTDIPRILIPYIVSHEMAHQLGYASESEANFVGYLSASSSPDPYFRYSTYLDLFSYAQNEEIKLFIQDRDTTGLKNVLKSNRDALDSLVKKDRKEIREFFSKRENKMSPMVSGVYDQYLKLNNQEAGIESYNDVIGWLLAYDRKYGVN